MVKKLVFSLLFMIAALSSFANEVEFPSKYKSLPKTKLNTVINLLPKLNEAERKEYLSSIKYFDCSWHQLDKVDFLDILEEMPNLKVLDLSHNEIKKISTNQFNKMSNVSRLDLSYNRLQFMEDMPIKRVFKKLEELNLAHNEIIFGMIPESENLISLDLSYNYLKGLSVPPLGKGSSLQYLRLAHNNYRIRKSHTDALTSLRYLDISDNDIEELTIEMIDFAMLKTLILEDNPIKALPENFQDHVSLKELDISRTQISQLPKIESLTKLKIGGGYMDRSFFVSKVNFNLREFIDKTTTLTDLSIVGMDMSSIQWILTHPNLTNLTSLSLQYTLLSSFPDISGFPKLKYLDISNNYVDVIPNSKKLKEYENLKQINVSVNVTPLTSERRSSLDAKSVLELIRGLPNTTVKYYNKFIDQNSEISERLEIVNSANYAVDPVSTCFDIYKAYLEIDKPFALISLQAALEIEKKTNPCSEKMFLLDLQCIELIEQLITTESKNLESTSGSDVTKDSDNSVESIILFRYKMLYNSFNKCKFSNEAGMNKVKAELYKAYANVAKIMEAEYEARKNRIQRLINGVGHAGTLSAIGTGLSAASFNNNLASVGQLLSGVSDWAANTAEEQAKYLMKINQQLSTEIVKFKEMANSFLD